MFRKISIFLLLGFVFLFVAGRALAQEEQIDQQASQDVSVSSADLGMSEPTVLPDSPFYFLKRISRTIQSAFTFNATKKAELSLKFANEKLLEARKLVEKNVSEEKIGKAIDNYKAEVEKVKARIENIKEKTPRVESLLNKFIDNNLKQQKIIDKISEKNEKLAEKIEQVKEKGLEAITSTIEKNEETKKSKKEEVDKLIIEFQAMETKLLSLVSEKKISLDENKPLRGAYDLAKKHFERAQEALKGEKIGEAWGQIQAAINAIKKTLIILEKKLNAVEPSSAIKSQENTPGAKPTNKSSQ